MSADTGHRCVDDPARETGNRARKAWGPFSYRTRAGGVRSDQQLLRKPLRHWRRSLNVCVLGSAGWIGCLLL